MSQSSITRILGCVSAAAAALLLSGQAVADHGTLSGDQIREVMVGNTATGVSSRSGRRWYGDYSPDGTYVLRVPEADWSTNGTWRIDGDLWCTERPQRSERCKNIEHVSGDDYQAVDDRRETLNFSIQR